MIRRTLCSRKWIWARNWTLLGRMSLIGDRLSFWGLSAIFASFVDAFVESGNLKNHMPSTMIAIVYIHNHHHYHVNNILILCVYHIFQCFSEIKSWKFTTFLQLYWTLYNASVELLVCGTSSHVNFWCSSFWKCELGKKRESYMVTWNSFASHWKPFNPVRRQKMCTWREKR